MTGKEMQKLPQAMILVDLEFLNGAIEEVYNFYPDFESEKLELERLVGAIMEQTEIQSGYRVTARFLSWEQEFMEELEARRLAGEDVEEDKIWEAFESDTEYDPDDVPF